MEKYLFFSKKVIVLSFLLFASITFAQQARPGTPIGGIVVKGGKNPGGNMLLSVGAGIQAPETGSGKFTYLKNGFALSTHLYVPVLELSSTETSSTSLGFNGGMQFLGMKNDYNPEISGFNISGQSAKPALNSGTENGTRQNVFIAEIGAQANFSFGKFTVSPVLNGGYFTMKESRYSTTQTSSVNGQTRTFEVNRENTPKTDGFVFIPKLRVSYFPGKVGFFIEGNYLAGPSVTTTKTIFKPNGTSNSEGFYSIDQMMTGKYETSETKNSFNAFGVNIGVSIPLGKSIREKGVRSSAAISSDDGNDNGPQSIIFGGNPPLVLLCYRLFDINRNEIPIDGFVNMYNVYAISLLPCGSANASAFVSAPPLTTEVGGQTIRVKLTAGSKKSLEGKFIKIDNDIDVSKDIAKMYQVETAFIKAGTYTFNEKNETLIDMDYGKSISEKGVKRNASLPSENKTTGTGGITKSGGAVSNSYAAGRLSMTPTTTKQTQGSSFGEKVAGGLQTGTGALAQGKNEKETNGTDSNMSSRPRNGTGPTRWWRHNNRDTNSCTGTGIYCFNRKFMDAITLANYTPEPDETLNEYSITLESNLIRINSITVKGSLSESTLKAFKDKKVELAGNYLSSEILEPLFKSIQVTVPQEGLYIKPEEQSYRVISIMDNNKPSDIILAVEKTNLMIDGKSYQVIITTSSGKSISEKGVSSTKSR